MIDRRDRKIAVEIDRKNINDSCRPVLIVQNRAAVVSGDGGVG